MENGWTRKYLSALEKIAGAKFLYTIGNALDDVPLTNDERGRVESVLAKQEKLNDLLDIDRFMVASNRTGPSSFVFKVAKLVQDHLSRQSFLKSPAVKLELDRMRKELGDLKKCLPEGNRIKAYARGANDGKRYVSFDMTGANFASLKLLSAFGRPEEVIPMDQTWAQFLRSVVPEDVRGDCMRNFNEDVVGKVTPIPEALYASKYIRVMSLEKTKALRTVWEYHTWKLVQYLFSAFDTLSYCINSDEIIVCKGDSEVEKSRVQWIEKTLADWVEHYCDAGLFRVHHFRLVSLSKGTDCLAKVFDNGTYSLLNVSPQEREACEAVAVQLGKE